MSAFQTGAHQLDLSNCNLDSFPKILWKEARFLTIKELNISSNKLTSLPPQINVLKALVVLDCTLNRLTDLPFEVFNEIYEGVHLIIYFQLSELPNLEFLNLSGNPLSKELTQRHLLGTASVLQYLRERAGTSSRFLLLFYLLYYSRSIQKQKSQETFSK